MRVFIIKPKWCMLTFPYLIEPFTISITPFLKIPAPQLLWPHSLWPFHCGCCCQLCVSVPKCRCFPWFPGSSVSSVFKGGFIHLQFSKHVAVCWMFSSVPLSFTSDLHTNPGNLLFILIWISRVTLNFTCTKSDSLAFYGDPLLLGSGTTVHSVMASRNLGIISDPFSHSPTSYWPLSSVYAFS